MALLLAYDSTRPELIPDHPYGVLPYADGADAWPAVQLARFPDARRRSITVLGDPHAGSIVDVERGDVRPHEAPEFLLARMALFPGTVPTVYCNRSTLPEVQARCRRAKIDDFHVWLATLDGSKPAAITGGGRLVAVQFDGGPDAMYDVSAVYNPEWLRPGPGGARPVAAASGSGG